MHFTRPGVKTTTWIKGSILMIIIALLITLVARVSEMAHVLSNHGFQINDSINKRNKLYAAQNRFGFTDKDRDTSKTPGIFRIAVLGDSFIDGDGIPYEKIWSHRLEAILKDRYDSVEVMSWGRGGWSTSNEFHFFRDHGRDFHIDLLVVGWVDNDPDVGAIPPIQRHDPEHDFPLAYRISPTLARFMQNNSYGDSYSEWIDRIYEPENLRRYRVLLSDFHSLLEETGTPALFVMTPSVSFDGHTAQRFRSVQVLLDSAGFRYYDLFPICKDKFKNLSEEDLQANPSNGHPGDIMTQEFAKNVADYLEQKHYLTHVVRKRP